MKSITKTLAVLLITAGALTIVPAAFAQQTTNLQVESDSVHQSNINNFLKRYNNFKERKRLEASQTRSQPYEYYPARYDSPLSFYVRNQQPTQIQVEQTQPYLTPAQLQAIVFVNNENQNRLNDLAEQRADGSHEAAIKAGSTPIATKTIPDSIKRTPPTKAAPVKQQKKP